LEKKRKQWNKKLLILGVIFILLTITAIVYADQNEIDKNALITYGYFKKQIDTLKDYIDQNIKKIEFNISAILNKVNELDNQVKNNQKDIESLKSSVQNPFIPKDFKNTNGVYEYVKVKKGQTIIFGHSSEFILRSGKAFSVLPQNAVLIDLTDGKDIVKNKEILKNHLILVVYNDGRGFFAVEDATCFVKGSYKIK